MMVNIFHNVVTAIDKPAEFKTKLNLKLGIQDTGDATTSGTGLGPDYAIAYVVYCRTMAETYRSASKLVAIIGSGAALVVTFREQMPASGVPLWAEILIGSLVAAILILVLLMFYQGSAGYIDAAAAFIEARDGNHANGTQVTQGGGGHATEGAPNNSSVPASPR